MLSVGLGDKMLMATFWHYRRSFNLEVKQYIRHEFVEKGVRCSALNAFLMQAVDMKTG